MLGVYLNNRPFISFNTVQLEDANKDIQEQDGYISDSEFKATQGIPKSDSSRSPRSGSKSSDFSENDGYITDSEFKRTQGNLKSDSSRSHSSESDTPESSESDGYIKSDICEEDGYLGDSELKPENNSSDESGSSKSRSSGFNSPESLEGGSDDNVSDKKVDVKRKIPVIFKDNTEREIEISSDEKKKIKHISKQLVYHLGYSKETASVLALQIFEKERKDPSAVFKAKKEETNVNKGFLVQNSYVNIHNAYINKGHYKSTFKASRLNIQTGEVQKVVLQKARLSKFVKQIEEEVKLQQSLDHPHIVKIYDVIPYASGTKIAMYVEKCGKDLEVCINLVSLNFSEKVIIARDISSALAYLHKKGYSHNDIKPDNILLKSRRGKLADFGLSQSIGTVYKGFTKIYAPETAVLQGIPPQDVKSQTGTDKTDVYQYGLTLWHLFHPNPPDEQFTSSFIYPTTNLFLNWPAQDAEDQSIQGLIRDCCDPSPEKRPSMEQIEERLSQLRACKLLDKAS